MLNVFYNDGEIMMNESVSLMHDSLNLDRILLAYESVCKKEDLDIAEAEIRCMEESGDIDTLENLYVEAVEDGKEKKKGLLKRVWEQIKKFFGKIKSFIMGDKEIEKLPEDEKLEVSKEGKEALNGFKGFCERFVGKFKALLRGGVDFFKSHEIPTLAKIFGAVGFAALAGFTSTKFFIKKDGEPVFDITVGWIKENILHKAEKLADEVMETADELEEEAEKASESAESSEEAAKTNKGIISTLKNVGNWIMSAIRYLKSQINSVLNKTIFKDDERSANGNTPVSDRKVSNIAKKSEKKIKGVADSIRELEEKRDQEGWSKEKFEEKKAKVLKSHGASTAQGKTYESVFDDIDMDEYDLPESMMESVSEDIEEIADLVMSL